MKRLLVACACVLSAAFLIVPPAASQGRNAPTGSSDAGRGTGADAGAASAAAAAAASSGSYSSSTTASTSYGHSSGPWVTDTGGFGRSYSGSYSVSTPKPSIQGTSFGTQSIYRNWNQYYGQISNYSWDGCTAYLQGYGYSNVYGSNAPHCAFSPTYFTRFYRNVEPLMTPALLKLTLRQPLLTSQYMLQAIDQLETMLADARAGKPVEREAIAAKSREIRDYAKRIRQDPTLTLYDIRDETDVLGNDKLDALSPESITKLRELALDIHLQLQNLSSLSSSSTMSVDSYKEPSFESMTKGIEKVCKAIESSSKRL